MKTIITSLRNYLIFIFVSGLTFNALADVTGTFRNVSFWATDGGRKFTASGGSGILKNEKNEVAAEGDLRDVDEVLTIKGKKDASFVHEPNIDAFPADAFSKEAVKDFASVELGEGNRWTLKDANFLFVLEVPMLNQPQLVPALDKSLARASLISFPKGIFTLWGYIITVEKDKGTVKFEHGKIIDTHNAAFKTAFPTQTDQKPRPVTPKGVEKSLSKTQNAGTNQLESIEGKVSSLSMITVAGPKSLFDTTLDLSEKDPKSTVVMALEGKPAQEFRILVSNIVNIDGFTDLKGKHEMMGGLLILSDLQKRVVGKDIVLKCRKIGHEDEKDVYGVAELELQKKTVSVASGASDATFKAGGKTAAPSEQPAEDDPVVEVKPLPGYAGFWRTTGEAEGRELVGDPKDRRALLEYKGEIEWDKDGNLVKGGNDFLRIKTSADPNQWYKIIDGQVESGVLVITAEDGVYTKFTEGKFGVKTTRPLTEAKITKDGKWKGKASFFITGFSPMGGATIYQDIRNYKVTKE